MSNLIFLENLKSSQNGTVTKDDVFNINLFEELNILGKVILNKPNETKTHEK